MGIANGVLQVILSALSVCKPRLERYLDKLKDALRTGNMERVAHVLASPPEGSNTYCKECYDSQIVCDSCWGLGWREWDPDQRVCKCHLGADGVDLCGPRLSVRLVVLDQASEQQSAGGRVDEDLPEFKVGVAHGKWHHCKKRRNWLAWDIFDYTLGGFMLKAWWCELYHHPDSSWRAHIRGLVDWEDVLGRHKLADKHFMALARPVWVEVMTDTQEKGGGWRRCVCHAPGTTSTRGMVQWGRWQLWHGGTRVGRCF